MPLDLDTIFGVLYLSLADFKARAKMFGADLTDFEDDDLKAQLALASRAVEAHCGGRLFVPNSIEETHRWNSQTRRISVNQPPVMTLETFTIRYAPDFITPFQVEDVLVNNQENYLELASLAFTNGLTGVGELLSLNEPLVEITYKSFQAVPPAVAAATGFTAARFLQEAITNEMLPAGLRRSKVGSEDITRADTEMDIPLMASNLLRQYQRIAIA